MRLPTLSPFARLAVAAAFVAVPVSAVLAAADHIKLAPGDIEWSPAPPSVPEGAESTVLYGNPGEEGLFALRLRLPAGYHIPPHTHPRPEVVTVISGSVQFGMGEEADPEATQRFGPGSFLVFEPGTSHFLFTDEEVVFQLNSTGPWALEYVDPEDDPRS